MTYSNIKISVFTTLEIWRVKPNLGTLCVQILLILYIVALATVQCLIGRPTKGYSIIKTSVSANLEIWRVKSNLGTMCVQILLIWYIVALATVQCLIGRPTKGMMMFLPAK